MIIVSQFCNLLIMQIGFSILIFLVIGIVVMALFCLITRYFNKKLQKALDDENEVYSMIDEIRGKENQEEEGNQYNDYVKQRENGEKNDTKDLMMEITQSNEPLTNQNDNYNKGRLKRRLNGENLAFQVLQQTNRSGNSIKSFRPEKLDSMRSMLSKRSNLEQTPEKAEDEEQEKAGADKKKRRNKKKDEITYHKYVSKIVAYSEEGIYITQNNLISIKRMGEIEEKRTIKKTTVKQSKNSFEDTLQAYGFEKNQYGAYKFESTLEIPHMKDGEEYPVASLKSTETKQGIQFSEYYSLKEELESEAA